jgi:hypothetical protein
MLDARLSVLTLVLAALCWVASPDLGGAHNGSPKMNKSDDSVNTVRSAHPHGETVNLSASSRCSPRDDIGDLDTADLFTEFSRGVDK